MDHFADERDRKLLENDRYTFFVLRRIMGGDCELLLTDHERLILCFSCAPYPVWIWTADDASEDEMEKAYRLAEEHALLDGTHSFNMKYELADYFIRRAAEHGKAMSLSMNMFAYDCPAPIEPSVKADGSIHLCTEDDLDEAAEFIWMFHDETVIDRKDAAAYRKDAENHIGTGKLYFWKNGQGINAASCKWGPNGDMAAINLVFTRPELRRQHYAENLVWQVTVIAKEAGYLPMLYTNADYRASNACYEKIGYVLRGKLCTIR